MSAYQCCPSCAAGAVCEKPTHSGVHDPHCAVTLLAQDSERLTDEHLNAIERCAQYRLTDEHLNAIERCAQYTRGSSLLQSAHLYPEELAKILVELRERRAADLSSEDVEALRWLRKLATVEHAWFDHQRHDPAVSEHVAKCEAGCRILDRIIAAHGEKP